MAIFVLYDSKCKICNGGANKIKWYDWTKKLTLISLHDEKVAIHWPELQKDDLMRAVTIISGGIVYQGAKAYRHLSLKMPSLWLFAPLLWFPFSLPFWEWLYALIADNRYMFNKCNENCSL